MQPIEVLRSCLKSLQDPSQWTTLRSARDASGNGCNPLDPKARRWCALGMIRRFAGKNHALYNECVERMHVASKALWGERCFMLLNDNEMFGRDAIVQCFQRAVDEIQIEEGARVLGRARIRSAGVVAAYA